MVSLCLYPSQPTALSAPDSARLTLIPSFAEPTISIVAHPPTCHHAQEFQFLNLNTVLFIL